MENKWFKFVRIDEKQRTIYLPREIIKTKEMGINLHYGINKIQVRTMFDEGLNTEGKFDDPLMIRCSGDVLDELMIKEDFTYQLLIKEGNIHVGPVIGFLMGEQYYYYHDRFLTELKDAMRIYKEVGGLFIAFKISGIKWESQCLYGLYYEPTEKQWKYGKLPLPTVIFRKSLQREGEDIEKLKAITNEKIFNTFKLDKLEVYEKLKKHRSFEKYLPPTKMLDKILVFNEFITEYKRIILKPKGLSRGRGICIIELIDENSFKVYDYKNSDKNRNSILKYNEMLEFLIENNFLSRDYIIQPHLELMRIDGNVFDIRVVMQKNLQGEWQCTGIECRVAGGGNKLTNISIGGKALTLMEAVHMALGEEQDVEKIRNAIIELSKDYCIIMDENDGIFAEYGLDIAMDVYGRYWFIEGNFRPAFKGFQLIGYNIYYDICYNTVRYAVSLAGFENRREKDGIKIQSNSYAKQ